MPVISTRLEGGILSFTPDGRINLPNMTRVPTIHAAIAVLGMSSLEEMNAAEKLAFEFSAALPDLSSDDVFKKTVIEKKAETAEGRLRGLGFLKPVNKVTTHPLRNKLTHIYNGGVKNQTPIETNLVSGWLQFLQEKVEEKQPDISPSSYLLLVDLIQQNYLVQVKRMIEEIKLIPDYPSLQKVHFILKKISSQLLNPRILYAQPFKETAEQLQKIITRIKVPEIGFFKKGYQNDIQKGITNLLQNLGSIQG